MARNSYEKSVVNSAQDTSFSTAVFYLKKNWKIKMLQTTEKILTSTKFHLWDVLKLKKKIIFHFRLFCSTFGHLKKKIQNLLKNSKNLIFLKFRILICDQNRPGIGQYVAGRLDQSPSLPQIFSMPNGQQLTNSSQKIYPPSPKKRAGGGGQELGGR